MAGDEFKTLARAGFAGIEFPVARVRVRGSGRHHVHTYAHVHGGDPEKLGRNLYEVEMAGPFLTSALGYPQIWPRRLGLLRTLFEAQHTDWLVIPTIGRMKAFATSWEQEMAPGQARNGEHASFTFLEDQADAFLVGNLVQVSASTVTKAAAAFKLEQAKAVEAAGRALTRAEFDALMRDEAGTRDLFDTILNLGATLLGVSDVLDIQRQSFENKVTHLSDLCAELDRRSPLFQLPVGHAAHDALKDIWSASNELAKQAEGPGVTFGYYTLAAQMTVSQVATAIYGDTLRATELLQLNAIENAFEIRAGTRVRYFADSSLKAA